MAGRFGITADLHRHLHHCYDVRDRHSLLIQYERAVERPSVVPRTLTHMTVRGPREYAGQQEARIQDAGASYGRSASPSRIAANVNAWRRYRMVCLPAGTAVHR